MIICIHVVTALIIIFHVVGQLLNVEWLVRNYHSSFVDKYNPIVS